MTLDRTTCENCGTLVPLSLYVIRESPEPIPTNKLHGKCSGCGKEVFRDFFQCHNCGRMTVFRSQGIVYQKSKDKYGKESEQPVEKFECEVCGWIKGIFRGMKASYERRRG